MSCPDWRVLRDEEAAAEAQAAARRHLGECATCRRAAAAFDPSLLFVAGAPAIEVSDDLVRQMRERVAGARAAHAAEGKRARRGGRLRSGTRWAAAVLLPALGVGLLVASVDRSAEPDPKRAVAVASTTGAATPVDALVAEALARLPLIEASVPVRFQEEGIGYDLVVVDTGSGL